MLKNKHLLFTLLVGMLIFSGCSSTQSGSSDTSLQETESTNTQVSENLPAESETTEIETTEIETSEIETSETETTETETKPEPPVVQTCWVADLEVAKTHSQLLMVEGEGIKATVTLYATNEQGIWEEIYVAYNANLGANGLGKEIQGDKKTPVGVYHFTHAFGIKPDPGTLFPTYTQVDESHYWVGDNNSPLLNTFVSTNDVEAFDYAESEHIIDYGNVYNYILSIDYNRECIPWKGSAIFLHCSSTYPTAGCISVSEPDMIALMRLITPECGIVIDTAENLPNY